MQLQSTTINAPSSAPSPDPAASGTSRPGRKKWIAPELTQQRRVELAREWLLFLGQDVDEQRVAELAPVVMAFHPLSPKGQIANRMVRDGQIPTPDAVRAEAGRRAQEREQAQRAAASAEARDGQGRQGLAGSKGGRRFGPATRMTPALRAVAAEHLSEQVCARLRAFVAQTREATGAGPAWSQVSKHMGWSREVNGLVLRAAIGCGVLTGTAAPNSLGLGSRTHVVVEDLAPAASGTARPAAGGAGGAEQGEQDQGAGAGDEAGQPGVGRAGE